MQPSEGLSGVSECRYTLERDSVRAESDSRSWSGSDGALEQLLCSVQAHLQSGEAASLALRVNIHRTEFQSLASVLRAHGEHLEALGISLVGTENDSQERLSQSAEKQLPRAAQTAAT